MKNIALASVIVAASMTSSGAHSLIANGADVANSGNIVIPCSSTPSGGKSRMVVTSSGIVGTACIAPNGASFYPYFMLSISMTNPPGGALGSTMDIGAILIFEDSGSGWGSGSFNVIDVSTTNISCPGLIPPTLLPGSFSSGIPACINVAGYDLYLY